MMHLTYPNAARVSTTQDPDHYTFTACVRYLSRPADAPPPSPYVPAPAESGNRSIISTAARHLVREWQDHGYTYDVYERVDEVESGQPWSPQGGSLGLAYLLALIRCVRRLRLEHIEEAGDIWCTGAIQYEDGVPALREVQIPQFMAKLTAFVAQTQDRIFLCSEANVRSLHFHYCKDHNVEILSLRDFRQRVAQALAPGQWPTKAVVPLMAFELEELVATLFAQPQADAVGTAAAVLPRRPYKFLAPFEPTDANLFFGRDKEIQDVVSLLLTTRLVILQGASGVGKTSLLRAGLLPRLPSTHYTVVMVETTDRDPIEPIKAALRRARGDNGLVQDQSLADCLAATLAVRQQPVVVILDSFEEFFRACRRAEERRPFRQALGQCLAEIQLDVHFLLAVREDYLGPLGEFQQSIRGLYDTTLRLERLTIEQATAAVVEPAHQLGLTVDMTLLTSVILPQLLDADDHIEPPLLQIVCQTLYQHAQQTGETTFGEAAYAAMGDVRTVLERYLESALQQFGHDHQQARGVLTALVTSEGTRWIAGIDELIRRLPPAVGPLEAELLELLFLRRLVQARLVRVYEVEGQTRYALIHDFLVPYVAAWVEEHERERRHILEMLDWYHKEHQRYGSRIPAEALKSIAPWEAALAASFPGAPWWSLIEQSKQAVRQQQRQRRRRLGTRLGAVGAVVLSIFLSILLIVKSENNRHLEVANKQLAEEKETAQTQRQNAEAAARDVEAQTRRANVHLAQVLVEKGTAFLAEGRLLHSYIFGAKALLLDPASVSARSLAYVSAVSAPYLLARVLPGPVGYRLAFSPDGQTLAAVFPDANAVWLWTLPDGQRQGIFRLPQACLPTHNGSIGNLLFNATGSLLIDASQGVVRLWAVPMLRPLADIPLHTTTHTSSSGFRYDEDALVVYYRDGSEEVWPRLSLLHMTSEALYQQAERETGMRVEGLTVHVVGAEDAAERSRP